MPLMPPATPLLRKFYYLLPKTTILSLFEFTISALQYKHRSIGKGFAIGSAALVSLALFGAFVTR